MFLKLYNMSPETAVMSQSGLMGTMKNQQDGIFRYLIRLTGSKIFVSYRNGQSPPDHNELLSRFVLEIRNPSGGERV